MPMSTTTKRAYRADRCSKHGLPGDPKCASCRYYDAVRDGRCVRGFAGCSGKQESGFLACDNCRAINTELCAAWSGGKRRRKKPRRQREAPETLHERATEEIRPRRASTRRGSQSDGGMEREELVLRLLRREFDDVRSAAHISGGGCDFTARRRSDGMIVLIEVKKAGGNLTRRQIEELRRLEDRYIVADVSRGGKVKLIPNLGAP